MLRNLLIVLTFLCMAPIAHAETVVASMSRDTINITANFDGSEIIVFGAVARQSPPPEESPLEVIITVEGPPEPLTVRRKERRFGIWINADAVEVDAAPSFYAVAATGNLEDVLRDTEDLRHRVSIDRAIRSVGNDVEDSQNFTEALIRIREGDTLYQTLDGRVSLQQETLFNTAVQLPANLVEGDYRTRIFLTRDGHVLDVFEEDILVQKVGLERFIYNLAHQRPLIYGLLSLAIAIAAGWLASAAFRLLRN